MINRPLAQVMAADLNALLADGTLENKTLEYKLLLPLTTDKDKKEFLADVSSFANAGGGDLIYGVAALDGTPTAIPGLAEFNEDKEILRLESSIRDGIEPRIPGVQFQTVRGFAEGPVLIIRVPRSWAAPHMVTFKGTSKFFARSSAGKFQMDVDELRTAFEGAGRLPERITNWRTERIGRIIANEGPFQLGEDGRLVIHLVPMAHFVESEAISIQSLYDSKVVFPPISAHGWSRRLNMDGLVTFRSADESVLRARSYTQVFRNGCVEAVCDELVHRGDGTKSIPCVWYEQETISAVTQFLKAYEGLGVAPPILCFLTLQGVEGAHMQVGPDRTSRDAYPIDRDTLVLPDVSITDLNCDVASLLRPVFDMVWNSCGYLRSFNYDSDGEWSHSRANVPS